MINKLYDELESTIKSAKVQYKMIAHKKGIAKQARMPSKEQEEIYTALTGFYFFLKKYQPITDFDALTTIIKLSRFYSNSIELEIVRAYVIMVPNAIETLLQSGVKVAMANYFDKIVENYSDDKKALL